MKKDELLALLIRESKLPPAEAADELDRLLSRIVQKLKKDQRVEMPGLGVVKTGRSPLRRRG